MSKGQKIQQGRDLASELFNLKLIELELMKADEQDRWIVQYPGLSRKEFEDVRRQVIQAKTAQQSRIGWQVIPRDLAVIVLCVVSVLVNLSAGVVAGVAVLILLESLFQVFYSEKLYKVLSYSVWFTYPAYILLVFAIRKMDNPWWLLAVILIGVWAGSFLLSFLARIPMALYLKQRSRMRA